METAENKSKGIFPKGEPAPADYFTGKVYLQMLAQKTESNDYSVGSVTFEPGARSNWHTSGGTDSHRHQRQRALSGKRKADQNDAFRLVRRNV